MGSYAQNVLPVYGICKVRQKGAHDEKNDHKQSDVIPIVRNDAHTKCATYSLYGGTC